MRVHESVTARCKETLEATYGFRVAAVREAPRGFAGLTFFVDTDEGDTYFLKMMKNPRRQAFFLHGLQVTAALREQGIPFIPGLIRTSAGGLHTELEGAPAALYELLDAAHTWDFDREDAFRKLAAIYRVSERFPDKGAFWQETFPDGFIARYEQVLAEFWQQEPATEEAAAIAELIAPHRALLERCPGIAARAAAASHRAKAVYRLTHSDYTNNVLVAPNGEQYLIDFDEAMFAPLERDGFLAIAPEDETAELWHAVMRETFPDYRVNTDFIRYYLFERFMVDLATFLQESVQHPDAAHRAKLVTSTRDYLVEWLMPQLRRWADRM